MVNGVKVVKSSQIYEEWWKVFKSWEHCQKVHKQILTF